MTGRTRVNHDPATYILARIEPDLFGGCWLWTKSLSHNGYGRAVISRGKNLAVHRISYEAFVGPIPAGLQLDHKCRVRCCCNPAHLEPVTRDENIRRGNAPHVVNARKTHCNRGHAFTAENTIRTGRGARACRACRDITNKERLRRNPGEPRRVSNAKKTHCKRGHPLSGPNLRMVGPVRECRICRIASGRAYRARKASQ